MDKDLLFASALHSIVNEQRKSRFKDSPQLSLGQLIELLEKFLPNNEMVREKYKEDITVRFDFEYAIPTGLSSWRGSYNELAIEFDFVGYEHFGEERPKDMTLVGFIDLLKSAMGKEFTGWKGGEFVMHENTPLWVANPGNSGETGIIGVLNNEYEIILITDRCEF